MAFIGVQPASAPLTASDITDGVVSTAKLGDDAVSLAKMASGTDGQVITYDASGNPSAVGPGTDGQVLTSTGAGSPPAFEDAGGGASTLISTANVSDGTSTVNVSFTGSYELYYVIFNKVSPNTNDNTFRHAFSDDDFTSANQQLYGAFYRQEARRDGSTSNSTNHQAATGYVRIADNVGEDEYEGLSGIIYYASMKTAAPKARYWGNISSHHQDERMSNHMLTGWADTTNVMTGVSYGFDSGTFKTGQIKLYGFN